MVNFSPNRSQGLVQMPWNELGGRKWRLNDVLSGQTFERNGNEMLHPGLYVDLEGWKVHFFEVVSENAEKN